MTQDSRLFIIVASGPSAKGFIPPEWATVIAVNSAIRYIPAPNHWFTLDLSQENQAIIAKPIPGVEYWAAADSSFALPGHVNRLQRVDNPRPRRIRAKNKSPQWWFQRLGCMPGLSSDKGKIHTGNSAYGALGLAKHLGATKVLLIGVDATSEEKVGGGFCRNLSHLPMLFGSAVKDIDFVSCGKLSGHGIRQMTISEGLQWLSTE